MCLAFFLQNPLKTCIIGLFGLSMEVVVKAWNKMDELDFSPHSSQISTLPLGICIFVYVPPHQHHSLETIRGGEGPKTIHKYMWPYIKSLAELENFVVG
jgi:hypothetical protein